jgi:hypothetical protein
MKFSLLPVMIIGVTSVTLIACGGGNESSQSSQANIVSDKINGLSVPPLPESQKNDATIEGIDVDKNGVRDDVDRLIAISIVDNPEKLPEFIEFAKAAQNLLSEKDEGKLRERNLSLGCEDRGISYSDSIFLHSAIFNTKERLDIYKKSQPESGLRQLNSEDPTAKCISSVVPFESAE